MTRFRLVLFLIPVLAMAFFVIGCGSDDSSDDSSSSDSTTTASSCSPDSLDTFADGVLTIGTDSPAYPPYFEDDDPSNGCLLYTSPSPRDGLLSRMPSSA